MLIASPVVIIKHATQKRLVGEYFAKVFKSVGLPEYVFQNLVLNHIKINNLLGSSKIDHVNSPARSPANALSRRRPRAPYITLGLKLNSKDPAYFLSDAKHDKRH